MVTVFHLLAGEKCIMSVFRIKLVVLLFMVATWSDFVLVVGEKKRALKCQTVPKARRIWLFTDQSKSSTAQHDLSMFQKPLCLCNCIAFSLSLGVSLSLQGQRRAKRLRQM